MAKVRSVRGVVAAVALSLLGTAGCGTGAATGTDAAAKAAGVAEAGTLKIGTSNNMKPYAYEENGELTGFEVDLISAAARKLHLKPRIVALEFSGLLPAVNNRQFDVAAAAVGITAPRKKTVDFSDGYLAGYFGVLTGPKSGITADAASTKGKRIAVLQGSIADTNANRFLPGADIVRFPDANSADLALKNDRVAGFFNDFEPNLAIAKKYPKLRLSQPVTVPATDYPAGWAVRKGNTALAGKLNGALRQLVDDGTWLRLYKKYFPKAPVSRTGQLPPYTAKGQQ
ncbi:ABC transporter substrate-binding protein [Streptomyces sp. NPDC000151]|uniref:ABC transporter substrate-binding protein n=1 Tax=Streptomyces sp. NPDC000151 TaxID=3154244 RepID=UPI00331A3604